MRNQVPYRVGVIGVGFGQKVHVPAFRMDSRFEVSALCASTVERAQTVASGLGVPRTFGDWRSLVADPDIDVVAVAVPPSLQCSILESAIEARKCLFLEKPVGGGGAKAIELARRARRTGVPTVVDFELEGVDLWMRARELLRERRLGPLRHAAVSWNVQTFAHREGLTSSWKLRAAEGGGTLNSLASHSLRYLEWLFGPITELCARLHPDPDTDETVHLWVRTKSGLPVSVVASTNSRNAHCHGLEIHGERGFLHLRNETPDYVGGFTLTLHADPMITPQTFRSELPFGHEGDGRIQATARLVRRLGDAIESGRAEGPGLEEGARVECLLDWARLSDREGRWVETETVGG